MNEAIILPPGVAIGILAFLLSLLPAGLFLWLWYLRRHDRPVPIGNIVIGFVSGILLVIPAFFLEKQVPLLWMWLSPDTAYYFDGAILPLQTWQDVLLPAVGTFLVVALIEEGLRYLVLAPWFRFSTSFDQIFDGLMIGLAAGLGFATLENTLYFFQLFSSGKFDTLVFVFFLRFLVSTLAHISFGGIMGTLLARGTFSLYHAKKYYFQAFSITWFLHGLYDWLLSINQTAYAVLLLLVPLTVLVNWSNRREFFVINRVNGKKVIMQKPPQSYEKNNQSVLQKVENPWNTQSTLVNFRRAKKEAHE